MTVLDVHPVGYARAAEALGDEVSLNLVANGEFLSAALSSCYGMAGTDDIGAAWASSYDAAAASANATLRDLVSAAYGLACLLEQSGINYAGADAAGVPGERAPESASRWSSSTAPAMLAPPSAAGLGVPEPSGWSMLAHLVGRLWPNGHQDLLHRAAEGWRATGDGVQALVSSADRAIDEVRQQRAPEVADAVTVLQGYRSQLSSFAAQCAAIGDSCVAYAHHLDEAHSHIIHECVEFVDVSLAAEMAGGLLAAFTVGISEGAAQGVVAAAAARAAEAIRAAIDTLHSMALGVAAELDAAGARLAELGRDVQPTLARSVQRAEIVKPGVAGQVAPMAIGPADTAIVRLEAYAHEWIEVGPASQTWARPATLWEHFLDHARDFGATTATAYARLAAEFLDQARLEGFPMKIDENGTVRIFDPATNTFGVYTVGGKTVTFFKPTSPRYWARQKGVVQ